MNTAVSLKEIFERMDKLNLWDAVMPYPWAFKPHGSVFPYFVYISHKGTTAFAADPEHTRAKVSLLFLEGWQSFHDFVRAQRNPNFGYYLSPSELPALEALYKDAGNTDCRRHDPGYAPTLAPRPQREMCIHMMWQLYGIMLRIESDPNLPKQYASKQKWSMLCRTEKEPDVWVDEPLDVPAPAPYIEHANIPLQLQMALKDFKVETDSVVEVDFRRAENLVCHANDNSARDRSVYGILIVDDKTGNILADGPATITTERTLKSMLEDVTMNYMAYVLSRGSFPAEVLVSEQRLFRLFRFLAQKYPFKLTLRDHLQFMDAAFKQWQLKIGHQETPPQNPPPPPEAPSQSQT